MKTTLNQQRLNLAKKEFLNAKEAAAFLSVSVVTLRRAIQSGASSIPFQRLGARYLFNVDALRRWAGTQHNDA